MLKVSFESRELVKSAKEEVRSALARGVAKHCEDFDELSSESLLVGGSVSFSFCFCSYRSSQDLPRRAFADCIEFPC